MSKPGSRNIETVHRSARAHTWVGLYALVQILQQGQHAVLKLQILVALHLVQIPASIAARYRCFP